MFDRKLKEENSKLKERIAFLELQICNGNHEYVKIATTEHNHGATWIDGDTDKKDIFTKIIGKNTIKSKNTNYKVIICKDLWRYNQRNP